MAEFEVRDWLDIINSEIETLKKEQYLTMSMMGSTIVAFVVLVWFTYTNFIQYLWMDIMLPIISIQNFIFYLIIFKRITNNTEYTSTMNRINRNLPVYKTDLEFVNNSKNLKIFLLLTILFIFLLFFELLVINNFSYYFIASSLIVFIVGMSVWIEVLFLNFIDPTIGIYQKLKYDVLSQKITNVEAIRKKYLLINGEPPEIIIMNEKGNYIEF